jgi:hypothetical protein
MRDKNAGAEKSHQYCCNLNHGTRPYAQPALTNTQLISPGLFRDDFVAPSKWFRRCFPVFHRLFADIRVTSFLSRRHRLAGVQTRRRVQTYLGGDGMD